MEINWKNIHYYILIAIFLNFLMLYYLKDNNEDFLEKENIIEISPQQAQYLLEKNSKKEKYYNIKCSRKNRKNFRRRRKANSISSNSIFFRRNLY